MSNDTFTPEMLDKLRKEYAELRTINPSNPAYKKLTATLDQMTDQQLKQIQDARINFMSRLATNRIVRRNRNTYNSEILVLDPELVVNQFNPSATVGDGGTVYVAGNDGGSTPISAMTDWGDYGFPPLGSDPLDPDNDDSTDNDVDDPLDADGDGMPDPIGGGGNGGGGNTAPPSGYVPPSGDSSGSTGSSSSGSTGSSSSSSIQTQANNAIEANRDAFEIEEYTPYLIGGAIAIGAGAVAGYAINKELKDDDDDSIVDRIFGMSKEYGEGAFLEYSSEISPSKKAELETLMKIDFARSGPLYRAHQRGELGLNLERNAWVIDGIPYNSKKFREQKGFATLPKVESEFAIGTDGFVIGVNDLISKLKSGTYYLVSSDANVVQFIDDTGEKRALRKVARGTKIPAFGNATPEQILSGKKTASGVEESTSIKATDSDEVKQTKRELERIERELRELNRAPTVKSITEQLEELARAEKRKKYQREQDEIAKQKREELAKEKEIMERVNQARALEIQSKRNQLKGIPIPDNQVDKDRYTDDKKWVAEFVNSGFGGKITSDDFTAWRYAFDDKNGSVLEIDWTEEFAKKAGYSAGFTEKWTRKALIDLQAVPISYGVGGYPNFKQIDGSITNQYPSWIPDLNLAKFATSKASATTVNPVAGVFVRNKNDSFRSRARRYNRSIRGDSFIGSRIEIPKNNARIVAQRARDLGKKARVIPSRNGYRVYVGPQRRNRR
jgi:hypothetical protein